MVVKRSTAILPGTGIPALELGQRNREALQVYGFTSRMYSAFAQLQEWY